MQIFLDLQNVIDSKQLPREEKIKSWITTALKKNSLNFKQPEITVRVVSKEESQQLNLEYREKDKPTNVLSFPFEVPEMIPSDEIGEYIGDLVICEQVVAQEALQQNKSLESHWAHMIIHGLLHLLGYDHIDDKEAEKMEALEIAILDDLDFPNPYL